MIGVRGADQEAEWDRSNTTFAVHLIRKIHRELDPTPDGSAGREGEGARKDLRVGESERVEGSECTTPPWVALT
jgi:hypothetical protein